MNLKNQMKWIVPVIFIAVLMAGVVIRNQKQVTPDSASTQGTTPSTSSKQVASLPMENYLAPDFTLQTVEGKSVTLSQLRGKPVFINFWASWCPPCRAEMPELVKESQKYKDSIQFYGINLTFNDNINDAKAFIQKENMQFPVLLEPNQQLATDYQVSAIPTSLFINEKGIIVKRITGAMDPSSMDSYFKQLLNK